MKVKNITKNTLYVSDLDLHIPYEDDRVIEFSPDQLKKSSALRALVLGRALQVVEYDLDEPVESSLIYLTKKKFKEFEKLMQQQSATVVEEEAEEKEIEKKETCLTKVSDAIEVRISGLFYDDSGYAKVNRNLALKLAEAGINVQIAPKNSKNKLTEDELRPLLALEKNKLSKHCIKIDSVVPSFGDVSSGKYSILYTTTESYTIPQQFTQCCDMYDEIWVTSPWSQSVLKKYTSRPVYCVPAGVDETLYCEDGPAFDFSPKVKDFVFISVFHWGYRKGYDVLLKAYFDEFDINDPVTLIIASKYRQGQSQFHKNKIKDDIEAIMKKFPNKDLPQVLRLTQLIAERDMPKLYRAANAFILPTRGEGSNLCAVESSLCGLPVIMTNCSGQTMYLRSDNAYLIEPDELVEMAKGQMHIHYWDGQKFPALTSDSVHKQTKAAMRAVLNNYAEAKQRNKKLQSLILSNYTWTHTANAAADRLQAIAEKLRKGSK